MTQRMLIVDDEETIRWALRELFLQDGWETHCAADAEEAGGMLRQRHYDYLITDLKMSGPSGIELVRQGRGLNPAMGVTVLTGYASLETAIQAVRLQVWDYVEKPCRIEDLKERVDQYFGRTDAAKGPPGAGAAEPGVLEQLLQREGTELVADASFRPSVDGEKFFTGLRRAARDLGFSAERTSRLVQCSVEVASVLLGAATGRARAGLVEGRLLVSITGPGPGCCTAEQVDLLSRRFGVKPCLLESGGECSVAFAELL